VNEESERLDGLAEKLGIYPVVPGIFHGTTLQSESHLSYSLLDILEALEKKISEPERQAILKGIRREPK